MACDGREQSVSQPRHGEPPRSHRRRDRHGQDGNSQGRRGVLLRDGRADIYRRHQGRPYRYVSAGRREQAHPPFDRHDGDRKLQLHLVPGEILRRLHEARSPRSHDGVGYGPGASCASARSHRRSERSSPHHIQDRRREGASPSRPQGPARHGTARRRQRRGVQIEVRQRRLRLRRSDTARAPHP